MERFYHSHMFVSIIFWEVFCFFRSFLVKVAHQKVHVRRSTANGQAMVGGQGKCNLRQTDCNIQAFSLAKTGDCWEDEHRVILIGGENGT